jgi:hypothetical protein
VDNPVGETSDCGVSCVGDLWSIVVLAPRTAGLMSRALSAGATYTLGSIASIAFH